MDVLGADAMICTDVPDGELARRCQRLFLFSRADTIYGGSNQIQRNIIGERVLGLPPEPKVDRVTHADAPAVPRGHGLLAGKAVLVTAAAGTGIGFATAKRCVEEGATRRDQRHPRAPAGEAAEKLATLRRGRAIPCDVTDEAEVQALFDGRRRARRHRRAGQQRRPRRHRRRSST